MNWKKIFSGNNNANMKDCMIFGQMIVLLGVPLSFIIMFNHYPFWLLLLPLIIGGGLALFGLIFFGVCPDIYFWWQERKLSVCEEQKK